MKTCAKCQTSKPVDHFSRNRTTPDGLQAHCRECCKAAARARYEANRGRLLAEQKEYREANREAIAARRAARNEANPYPNRARASQWQRGNRAAAIAVYGGACVRCGSSDRPELDHVNSDGREHRKVEPAARMYARIARTGKRLPDWELQVLCHGCHRTKTDAERRNAL